MKRERNPYFPSHCLPLPVLSILPSHFFSCPFPSPAILSLFFDPPPDSLFICRCLSLFSSSLAIPPSPSYLPFLSAPLFSSLSLSPFSSYLPILSLLSFSSLYFTLLPPTYPYCLLCSFLPLSLSLFLLSTLSIYPFLFPLPISPSFFILPTLTVSFAFFFPVSPSSL